MSQPPRLAPLKVRKNEERRLIEGHPWVFSNEVDVDATPLSGFAPGDAVAVQDYRGRLIGSGYVNPHSLICARLLSGRAGVVLDRPFLEQRIRLALQLRERLYTSPHYRLVYGEGDGLPGLIVDRYGDVLVVQIGTAGMERVKTEIIAALRAVFTPRGIYLRNDASVRSLEGLPEYVECAFGDVPETVSLEEWGAEFTAPLGEGQKTGWFFDQRDNRSALRRLSGKARVLDVFCYAGGFGVQAALGGAEHVLCVDESQLALDCVRDNAKRNGVQSRLAVRRGDAFDTLRALDTEGARFDIVVLDPPAFIKRRKDQAQGQKAYRRINELAMRLVGPGGLILSCSCSYHLAREDLQQQMAGAAHRLGLHLQVLAHGEQGADHPPHPAVPETAYLKTILARLVNFDAPATSP